MQGVMVRQLLQQLCRAPLKIFTPVMVELSVSCWYWLLAARPPLKLQVRSGRSFNLNEKNTCLGLVFVTSSLYGRFVGGQALKFNYLWNKLTVYFAIVYE